MTHVATLVTVQRTGQGSATATFQQLCCHYMLSTFWQGLTEVTLLMRPGRHETPLPQRYLIGSSNTNRSPAQTRFVLLQYCLVKRSYFDVLGSLIDFALYAIHHHRA